MSKRNNDYNHKKERTWRNIGFSALCVLLAALSAGMLMFGAGVFEKERNPDNLITLDDYILTPGNTNKGIEVDYDTDTGVVKVKGKSTSAGSVGIATVTLKPGTYTLSGVNKPSEKTFGLMADVPGVTDPVYANTAGSSTFTITEETTITISLFWGEDYKVEWQNRSVYPCLVADKNPGDFWAE